MSPRSTTNGQWTRVFLRNRDELAEAERSLGVRLQRSTDTLGATVFPVRLVHARPDAAEVHEVVIILRAGQVTTLEAENGAPHLDAVELRLLRDSRAEFGPAGVILGLIEVGFDASAGSLAMLERELREVHASKSTLVGEAERLRTVGVSDLPAVSEILTSIDEVLSHTSYTVNRLSQLARRVRRGLAVGDAAGRARAADLVTQGDALTRRVEFIVDRHRFHRQSASQQISTSDLNIVKIFTVLWAILIPGTTLINWYGQNFAVMPALSWPYTSPVQLIGVFLLTALPIYVIKRAGQLR